MQMAWSQSQSFENVGMPQSPLWSSSAGRTGAGARGKTVLTSEFCDFPSKIPRSFSFWRWKLERLFSGRVCVCVLVPHSRLTLCDPMGCSPPSSCPWDFPGKNTGVGCCFLLQGICPIQESNLGPLCCRQTFYHLSHQRLSGHTNHKSYHRNKIFCPWPASSISSTMPHIIHVSQSPWNHWSLSHPTPLPLCNCLLFPLWPRLFRS